jgi:hypothetical protein
MCPGRSSENLVDTITRVFLSSGYINVLDTMMKIAVSSVIDLLYWIRYVPGIGNFYFKILSLMTWFQGTVAQSEQSCGLCSGVLTSVGMCRVFVQLLTQVERFTVSQSRDRG